MTLGALAQVPEESLRYAGKRSTQIECTKSKFPKCTQTTYDNSEPKAFVSSKSDIGKKLSLVKKKGKKDSQK